MIYFPNSKINLGLHVLGKRSDGYHDLESLFYPIPFTDILEIIQDPLIQKSEPNLFGGIAFSSSGLEIPGENSENLCVKAAQLLKKDFPIIPSIRLHLHKSIPIGAGLGGGSADAAFTLSLLNNKFNLKLSQEQLIHYAAQLGSDCPFFILNQPCFASGRGEKLEPVSIDLSGYSLLLVYPGIHINTGWAFSNLKPVTHEKSILDLVRMPIMEWNSFLVNDFESLMMNEYPEIKSIKENMYYAGAIYASMTGSGSAVFGIFKKNQLPELFRDKNYFQKKLP